MKSEPLANKSDTDRAIEAGQKRMEAGQKEELLAVLSAVRYLVASTFDGTLPT